MKSKSSILLTPSYFYKIIKCLSKLHGVFARIVSTFVSLSKVKSMIWFPRFLILKPRLDLFIGIKVSATASGLSALLVRNLAARMETRVAISSCSRTLGPSLWEMVRPDHYLVRSSMNESLVSYNPYKEKNNKKP